jgi:hypothetical protein
MRGRRARTAGLTGAVAGLLLLAGCAGGGPAPTGQQAGQQAGQPAGRSATATATAHPGHPPSPAAAPLRAGERLSMLTVPRPYAPAPPPGATDDYRCFVVDPGLTRPAFLTGSQFLPSNAAVVHHAIFYRVDPSDVAAAARLDAADPADGWSCFGGTGVGGSGPDRRLNGGGEWVAAWAPGAGEAVSPAGTGYLLRPGGRLVMQVHYNLLRAGAGATDRPGIRLRLMDGTAEVTALRTTLLPAPVELPCAAGETGPLCDRETAVLDVMRRFGDPAGGSVAGLTLLCSPSGKPVAGPVQQCDHPVRRAGTVLSLAGHMHLLGTAIKVELNPGTPRARVLLDVPAYNFHDQRSVPLPAPVAVRPGDSYRVTCTHDPAQRRHLEELRGVPPRYVVWGDGTTDEMCLGIVIGSA